MLSSKQCKYTRALTRDAFLEAHGNRRQAIRLARRNLRADPKSILGMLLISVAIRLAVWLITKWIEENVTIPPDEYQCDELGYAGLTTADLENLPPESEEDDQ